MTSKHHPAPTRRERREMKRSMPDEEEEDET